MILFELHALLSQNISRITVRINCLGRAISTWKQSARATHNAGPKGSPCNILHQMYSK